MTIPIKQKMRSRSYAIKHIPPVVAKRTIIPHNKVCKTGACIFTNKNTYLSVWKKLLNSFGEISLPYYKNFINSLSKTKSKSIAKPIIPVCPKGK